jgi:hypothetical protein
MTHDDHELILTGKRFFGRIRAFDLACPRCDQVYQVGQGSRTMCAWDKRTSRFRCVCGCGLRMNLGILGWNVSLGPGFTPADASPLNADQAAQLRDLTRGIFLGEKLPYKGDQNRVIGETACSCVRIDFDPGCPLHGRLR